MIAPWVARMKDINPGNLCDLSGPRRHDQYPIGKKLPPDFDGQKATLLRFDTRSDVIQALFLARESIERAEGLVHEQERRIVDKSATKSIALPDAARKS